jgi:hypothetical protein
MKSSNKQALHVISISYVNGKWMLKEHKLPFEAFSFWNNIKQAYGKETDAVSVIRRVNVYSLILRTSPSIIVLFTYGTCKSNTATHGRFRGKQVPSPAFRNMNDV